MELINPLGFLPACCAGAASSRQTARVLGGSGGCATPGLLLPAFPGCGGHTPSLRLGWVQSCSETSASGSLSVSRKKIICLGFFFLRWSLSPNHFLGAGFFFNFATIWVWEEDGGGRRGFRGNALQGEISALQQALVGTEGGGWRATCTDGDGAYCTSLGKWLINTTGIYSSI